MKLSKKTLIAFMLSVGIMLIFGSAYAKNGDVIGKIYSTDILLKIDGISAPSYNIGGKTAIVIEELSDIESMLNYAVYPIYDDETRTLNVRMSSSKGLIGEQYDKIERGTAGKIVGDIYETDIKVYINGYEIDGMNIGGKTAVAVEDLGKIGGANEDFGYSKYRCTADWDAENRVISLNFIDEDMLFVSSVYGGFLAFHMDDDIITADFDRLGSCYSYIASESLSDEFAKDTNVLKPLYFDNGKEKTEVGFMYVDPGEKSEDIEPYAVHYITKPELLKQLCDGIWDGKTPSAEEAFATFDDKKNYETLDKFETEDFYVLTVKLLNSGDEFNDIIYVAVKKSGGYGVIYGGSTKYTQRVIKSKGENIVVIGYGPTADPHGNPAILNCEFNLNNFTSIR